MTSYLFFFCLFFFYFAFMNYTKNFQSESAFLFYPPFEHLTQISLCTNHLGQPLRGTDNLIFFSLLIFLLFFSFLFFFVDVLYRLSLQEFLRDLSWDKARTTKLTRKPLTNFLVDCIADTGETLTGLARWIFY